MTEAELVNVKEENYLGSRVVGSCCYNSKSRSVSMSSSKRSQSLSTRVPCELEDTNLVYFVSISEVCVFVFCVNIRCATCQ